MKISHVVVLTTMLLAADDPDKGSAPKTDLEKLQGTWSTVSMVINGKTVMDEKTPPKKNPSPKVAYEGNRWIVKVGDRPVAVGTIKVDATKTPKQLDVMDESGIKNTRTKLAIYELDGDTLKYCIALPGAFRPTKFESKEGSGHSLIVSKREKP